ncbi:MAG TPA: hypothetical protein VG820_13910 [Fimbriimonadaceae bacterium]|nr:hypothetical protein [Fimbriimonadaceae bacterium]
MGALPRVRCVAGLASQPGYPNLETLLQAQVGQMHEDCRVLS